MTTSLQDGRRQLRKQLRSQRRSLSAAQQEAAARALLKKLRTHPVFVRSHHLAFYMAEDGEIDPCHILKAAAKMGKRCYLPILHPFVFGKIWFARYTIGDPLVKNYFGLAEPLLRTRPFPPWGLDMVLLPLVGFDRRGQRLGMGGGFYDRTFGFIGPPLRRPRRPQLVGLAHHCQEVQGLTKAVWDVALDYIITDRESIQVSPK